MSFSAGQIVLVDWRDALPKEPNKKRPAVVVEDHDLFDPSYPNLILVPITEDPRLAIAVTTTSKQRVRPTPSRVTAQQVADIRRLITVAIGIS